MLVLMLRLTERRARDVGMGLVGAWNAHQRKECWAPTTDDKVVADLFDALAEAVGLPARAWRVGRARR